MKTKTQWVCQECGFSTSKALGRCTECGNWNSFCQEHIPDKLTSLTPSQNSFPLSENTAAISFSEIDIQADSTRYLTGFTSLDEVCGGGIVPGAITLLAGEPGIGKSTLLLQLAGTLAKTLKTIYICAEESTQQLLVRAKRLGLEKCHALVATHQNIANILNEISRTQAQFVIIDSIQAIFHPEIESAAGSVSQVRESAAVLVNLAKSQGISIILVGHVTKDGFIAGPKVLEHMVDVVLQFEGDRYRQLRTVRATKNRFGSTSELALFNMQDNGLTEVKNPSMLFVPCLEEHLKHLPSGTAIIASAHGARAMLLEVQALVTSSNLGMPRRVANGFDTGRLMQIIAVLEKRVGLALSKQDIYVNMVGGFDCNDPGGDLGVAMALAGAYLDSSIDPRLVCAGEISLTGELRPVAALEKRLKEAESLGFKKAIVPGSNTPASTKTKTLEVISTNSLVEALSFAIPKINKLKTSYASKSSTNYAPQDNATEIGSLIPESIM